MADHTSWDIYDVDLPCWGDRPSLYRHVRAHIRPGETGLAEDGSLRERTVRMDEGREGHAFGVEAPWIAGWDCTVVFDDEVVGGLEWETLDQLRDNLAASEGITEVVQEDREVFHLRVLNLDFPSVEAKVAEAVEQTDIGDPADRHR